MDKKFSLEDFFAWYHDKRTEALRDKWFTECESLKAEIARLEAEVKYRPFLVCCPLICEARRESVEALESQVTQAAKKVEAIEREIRDSHKMIAEGVRIAVVAIGVAESFQAALARSEAQLADERAERIALNREIERLEAQNGNQAKTILGQSDTIRDLLAKNIEANRRAETYMRASQAAAYGIAVEKMGKAMFGNAKHQAEDDDRNGRCCRDDRDEPR